MFDQFRNDADPSLLFVLDWGNRPTTHRPVRWLLNCLTEATRHVHAATLPIHITNIQQEWLRPLERYSDALDSPTYLSHITETMSVLMNYE